MLKRVTLLTILAVALGFWAHQTAVAQSTEIIELEIKGVVTPAMVSYFERGIAEAEARDASAVLVILDTPGGSVDATLEIVRAFRNADVPVIVYVGPAGAQAASGGSIITMAAHAAAMAPETIIGAAAVIDGSGGDLGETAALKATEDLQAVVRGLTNRRGETAMTLAESMIDEARAVTAAEALAAGLIDVRAADIDTLLAELDGLEITVNDSTQTLATAGALRSPLPLTTIEQVLLLLSNPTIIGVLLAIAVPAILIELQAPGGWVAGFLGVTCLFLALYGLGQLPVNYLGLALIAVGFVLLGLEVKLNTIVTGVVGALTLVGGLLLLFNSDVSPSFVSISVSSALAIGLSTSAFFLFIATMALRAQQRPAATGTEGLIGRLGRTRSPLDPEGSVLLHGEIWRARASKPVPKGSQVVVKSRQGFTLEVEPVDDNGPTQTAN